MKIRLIQTGWEGYTGNFGGVEFKDGESVLDVAERDARRLANIVRIEQLDGVNPSSSQQALDSKCQSMGVLGSEPFTGKPQPVLQYSREQLENIAGDKGIKGLREIGDVYGVKANGIADLIKVILNAQASKAAVEAPTAAPAPAPAPAPVAPAPVDAQAAPVAPAAPAAE